MIELLFELIAGFLIEWVRGLPILFRRRLPGHLNVVRWVALLSPCLVVVCWYAARQIGQIQQQETTLELLLGIVGWAFVLAFFVGTSWCGFAVAKNERKGT